MRSTMMRFVVVFLIWALGSCNALAGVMTREKLAELFPAPMVVGEKDGNFPVWPLFNGGAGDAKLAGWIYESTDLAPIPGFSGTAPNLLITLAPDGTFIDVRVLSHHEPVFLEGLGQEPLVKFLDQYRGMELGKPIKVGSNINSADKKTSSAQYINGVSKATASVLIINQTILAASVKIARGKLGYAGSSASANPAKPRDDIDKEFAWETLLSEGLVQRIAVTNDQVEKGFANTVVEGQDAEGLANPTANIVDLFIADPTVPSVGYSLLGQKSYAKLVSDLSDGQPAILIISAGRWSAQGENWTPGSVPDRIAIKQAGLPITVRDMAFDKTLPLAGVPAQEVMILKIPAQAGFDPASPFEIVPHITRSKGMIYPDLFAIDLPGTVKWPEAYYLRANAEAALEGWQSVWQQRWLDLAIISAALALLTTALVFQKRLTQNPKTFNAFRLAFLTFTLVFIGWYAQAQLSIVTLLGIVNAATNTHDFAFLLWDPPSLLLWAFTLITFVIWGRGVFCGWLCPFGALQEFAAEISKYFRIPQWRISPKLDEKLRYLKYVTLAVILFAAFRAWDFADSAVEVEPFKTSITLVFVRHWPFVVYAVALILINLFVYKAFCRYLCPLGAAMAIGGKLRILDWIPRRAECGSPCQLCKVKCRYGAIEKTGAINYTECFQCLDCVAIYFDPKACVPDIQAAKRKLKFAGNLAT
jgi:NosR/NirI family transcriptional regulator, nitrous oxide reductase regulator